MKKQILLAAMVMALTITAVSRSYAEEASPTPGEPEALPLLQKMGDYLSKAAHFSVTIREGYDVLQDSGQKIEFGATRKMVVDRPDHLRIDVEKSGGEKDLVIFDGKAISLLNAKDNVYAVAPKEGSLDDAIKYAVADLGLQVPLAVLFLSTLPAELEARVVSSDYVETATIDGVTCDHVTARTDKGVDFQLWIAQGNEPLPRRIVITYAQEEGEPQFWADFTAWNLAPEIASSTFTFSPPDGAEQVQFVSQMQNLARPAQSPKKGAKK